MLVHNFRLHANAERYRQDWLRYVTFSWSPGTLIFVHLWRGGVVVDGFMPSSTRELENELLAAIARNTEARSPPTPPSPTSPRSPPSVFSSLQLSEKEKAPERQTMGQSDPSKRETDSACQSDPSENEADFAKSDFALLMTRKPKRRCWCC